MSEWWTYHLRDFLLFSARTYARLFERYNRDMWPLHVAAIAAGLLVLFLLWKGKSPRTIAAILAVAWLWTAYGFLWKRYATINWAAKYFAIAFVIEAIICVAAGFSPPTGGLKPAAPFGVALFVFALAIYPLLSSRHEVFGMTPDPTALATAGVFLAKRQWMAMIIPLLWCVISGLTLWALYAARG